MNRLQWSGAALLAVCALAWPLWPASFFSAWLVGWWFCLGVLLGALGNQCIHALTGGKWGEALRPATDYLAARAGWQMLLFVPLLFAWRALYPWASDPHWAADMTQPAFKQVWLSLPFALVRACVYLIVWWWLARVVSRPRLRRGAAAAVLAGYGVVVTLAAVDGIASLTPAWRSSSFGLVVSMGQFFAGSAFACWFVCRANAGMRAGIASGRQPITRDFGNLLMMYVLMWAYLAFTQFQIIWAENLPHEIGWYVPRLAGGWLWVGVALVVLHFFVPLILLLFRDIKDSPVRLGRLSAALVLVHVLDVIWLIVPSRDANDIIGALLSVLVIAGMAMLLWGDAPYVALPREAVAVEDEGDSQAPKAVRHA